MLESGANKIALFIDGANLHFAAKALGFDIDYSRLLQEFKKRGTIMRAYYYTAIIEGQDFASLRPLTDWLDYNGFTVVAKPAKEGNEVDGRRKFKRNIGVEIVVRALEMAEHVDEIVLFSGDGDFRSLVESLQRRGVRVTVVSTLLSKPPMIADELRRQTDVFIDLMKLRAAISRTLEGV